MTAHRPALLAQQVPDARLPWWTIFAFTGMAVFLAIVICWDFVRWLLSGIWPVEQQHRERPGS